jgi:branched-chain amino acid transport system substrate-binding protein
MRFGPGKRRRSLKVLLNDKGAEMRILRIAGLVLAGLLAASVLRAQAQTSDQPTIKIGWIGHLTGVLSSYSEDMLTAAKMAVDDVNTNGGVLGRKLELLVRDDRGDPSQAVTLARELDTQEQVTVLTGTLSTDVSRALRDYAEANHIPYISASSGDSSITAPGTKWTMRVQPPAAVQGAAMSRFVTTLKPDAKIAVVRHDILFFPELMNGAIWYLEKSGKGKLVYNEYFAPRQSDFNVVAAQLKEANPDFVLFGLNEPGLQNFVRAALAVGFKPEQLFCYTVETGAAQKALGKDIIGTYAATFFDEGLRAALPQAGKVSDQFFAIKGYYPGYIVGNAYSTVEFITQAIKAKGSLDREAVNTALHSTEFVDASGQKTRFDENGRNILNTTYIMQAVAFDDKRLTTFQLKDTIRFDPNEVPDIELSKLRK